MTDKSSKSPFLLFKSLLLLFLAALSITSGGCSRQTSSFKGRPDDRLPASSKRLQNVVLITIDTLRADHLGCYGNPNIQTPHIDALARQGIMFRRAFSPVPLTLPSHASIMTGLYPPVHGIRDNGHFVLSDDYRTMAEVFKERGYATGAVVAAFVLNSRFGLAQGFDFYEDAIAPDQGRNDDPFQCERRGDKVLEIAQDWLAQNREKKLFLWLHFYDPHHPYEPPEPQRSTYTKEPYDGEIAYTDACLGQLLGKMEELNLRENTLLVLTSDHGEGLGEHGEKTHGVFIYDSALHVPLIISSPGWQSASDRQSASDLKAASRLYPDSPDFLVRIIDIMPTVLGLMGLAKQGESYGQGVNLMPWLEKGKSPPDLMLYAESLYCKLNFDWSPLKGVRSRDWKYIQAPTSELYQVSSDPGETKNLLEPGQGKVWESRLRDMESEFTALRSNRAAGSQIVNDREVRQRLESLGYVCAPGKTASSGADRQFDPKDMIHVLESLDQAQILCAAGKLESAALQFEKILNLDPGNIFIHYLLGDVYNRQGKWTRALDHYRIVLKEQEDYLEVQNNTGSVYDHMEDYEHAIQHFQKAASLYPDQPRAYNNLGIIYIKTNQLAEAQDVFMQALERGKGDEHERAISYRCLGDTRLRMGDEEKARQYYQQALSLRPGMVEVYLELARYYTGQRRYSLAIPQWEMAVSLLPQDVQSLFTLGQCYLMSGDRQKAEQMFRQCLQVQPDNMQARRFLESLGR